MQNLFDLVFYDNDISALKNELKVQLEEKSKVNVIYTPNVDHIITVFENPLVNNVYKNANILVADGWPLVSVSKLKKKKIFKITGVDLMEVLLQIANENNKNIFFLGSTDETLISMSENIKKDFKGINNISYYNGYFTDDENAKIADLIKKNKTDILFVGMGHPKQEIWIHENKDQLGCKVIIAVGGAFKIFSNEIKRAPILIQKMNLEWFWRFAKEPTRLFKRYFIRYPKFIRIALNELKQKN